MVSVSDELLSLLVILVVLLAVSSPLSDWTPVSVLVSILSAILAKSGLNFYQFYFNEIKILIWVKG